MGEVHRAYDTDTDRVVALKVLAPQFVDDEVYRSRFQREARAAAKLREPHIVPIHDFGEIGGRLFLEMRLVEGPNLARLLADEKRLTPAAAVAVIGQIAAALDAAHAEGLVHRDVKPSNILIAADDFAYLIDFGIARSEGDTTLTATGAMIGTFAYMAPERLTDDDSGVPSDVYSLTCVLYECLTGAKPYTGESVQRQIAAHLNEKPPRPSTTGIPAAFDAVIAKGMAKKPDARYASAGDLAAAAQRALARMDAPPRRPQRALGTAAAVLIFAVAVGSALALTRTGSTVVTDAPAPGAPVPATVAPAAPLGDPVAPLPDDSVPAGTVPADDPAPAGPPTSVTVVPATGAPAAEPAPTTSQVLPGDPVAEPGATAPPDTTPPDTTPPAPPPVPPPATETSEPPPDTTTETPDPTTTAASTPPTTTSAPSTTPSAIPSAKGTSAAAGMTREATGTRSPAATTTGTATAPASSTPSTPHGSTIATTLDGSTTTTAEVTPTG